MTIDNGNPHKNSTNSIGLSNLLEHTAKFPLDGIDYASIEYPDAEQLEIELQIINTIIGYKLREIRLSARFTEGELASLLGVSAERVRRYESGEQGITLAEVFKICEELGASAGYFLPSADSIYNIYKGG